VDPGIWCSVDNMDRLAVDFLGLLRKKTKSKMSNVFSKSDFSGLKRSYQTCMAATLKEHPTISSARNVINMKNVSTMQTNGDERNV
jgi:hypothetical protein